MSENTYRISLLTILSVGVIAASVIGWQAVRRNPDFGGDAPLSEEVFRSDNANDFCWTFWGEDAAKSNSESYRGKLLQVTGKVTKVTNNEVTLSGGDSAKSIQCRFVAGSEARSPVESCRRGQTVSIKGIFSSASFSKGGHIPSDILGPSPYVPARLTVYLDRCRIENVK